MSGGSSVGGLVGWNGITVSECYSTGRVSGRESVGGLVGYNDYGTVSRCYSSGRVSGGSSVGGLVGYNWSGRVLGSYWDVETSGQSTSAGGEGKTTAEMKQRATYTGWDFANVWDIVEGQSYPYLRVLGETVYPVVVEKEIRGLEELAKIGRDWDYPMDGRYKLMVDIDASETIGWDGGKGFKPLVLAGSFDGNGHVIRNLYINRVGEDYVGLFGYVGSGGEVRNLGLENVQVSGRDYVGGLVGENWGTVSGCYSTGSVLGGSSVGGLVGRNDSGTISQCYTTGNVSGSWDYIGGLVGYNDYYGTVSECYSTGRVSGDGPVGGLVGRNSGTVSECYSTGSVSGGWYVGGLVGENYYGTVSECYSVGSVSGSGNVGGLVGGNYGIVSQCYSTGKVSGSWYYIGGLVGWNSGRVLGSYWDVETSGQSTSAGGEGKSGIEMRRRVTYVGWDFDVVWGIVEGLRTPYFRWQSSVGGELRLLEVDGSEWRGILGAGVYDYYKVVYGGGRVYVMLELEPEVGGRWELIWSKFGRCDMYRNDGVVESLGGVVRRLIVINPGEVYYVSVLYLGGVGFSGGYKIRAYSVVGREVSSFEPRFGSNVGEVSIRLSGLGMSEAKFLRLLDSGGRVLRRF